MLPTTMVGTGGGEGYDLGRFSVPYFLCLCYNKYNKVNKSSMYIRKEFLL